MSLHFLLDSPLEYPPATALSETSRARAPLSRKDSKPSRQPRECSNTSIIKTGSKKSERDRDSGDVEGEGDIDRVPPDASLAGGVGLDVREGGPIGEEVQESLVRVAAKGASSSGSTTRAKLHREWEAAPPSKLRMARRQPVTLTPLVRDRGEPAFEVNGIGYLMA